MPAGGTPLVIPAGRPAAGAAVPPGPTAALPSLQGGGFLSPGFVNRDAYRYRHVLLVRQPSAGMLDGLVVQVSDAELGLGSDGGTAIRDTDLGRIVARMGPPGGARFATNLVPANAATVQGNGGSWVTPAADWAGSGLAPRTGRAAATVSFGNAAMLSDYLNRYDVGIPEANTMRAGLNMGGNDITAARNVTATGTLQVGGGLYTPATFPGVSSYLGNGALACSSNATGCKFWISDDGGFADYNDGWIRYQGGYAGAGLSIEGAGNNLYVGGSSTTAGAVSAGLDVTAGRDVTGMRNVASGQDIGSGRDLYVTRNANIGQDVDVGNTAYVRGRLSTSDDVVARGNVSTGIDPTTGSPTGAGWLVAYGGSYVSGDSYTTRNAAVGDRLFVGYDVGTGAPTGTGALSVSGTAYVTGNVTTSGFLVAREGALLGVDPVTGTPTNTAGLTLYGTQYTTGQVSAGGALAVGGQTLLGYDPTNGNPTSAPVHASGRISAGQQTNLARGYSPNTGCDTLGAVAADWDGSLVSCRNGVWTSASTQRSISLYALPNSIPGDTDYSIGYHFFCAVQDTFENGTGQPQPQPPVRVYPIGGGTGDNRLLWGMSRGLGGYPEGGGAVCID